MEKTVLSLEEARHEEKRMRNLGMTAYNSGSFAFRSLWKYANWLRDEISKITFELQEDCR